MFSGKIKDELAAAIFKQASIDFARVVLYFSGISPNNSFSILILQGDFVFVQSV